MLVARIAWIVAAWGWTLLLGLRLTGEPLWLVAALKSPRRIALVLLD